MIGGASTLLAAMLVYYNVNCAGGLRFERVTDIGCFIHNFTQYEIETVNTSGGWEDLGGDTQEETLFARNFNFTVCLIACTDRRFMYMAVIYFYGKDTMGCRCGADRPATGYYGDADAIVYCGYRCTSVQGKWCLHKEEQPFLNRGKVYLLTYNATTDTPAGITTDRGESTSPVMEKLIPTGAVFKLDPTDHINNDQQTTTESRGHSEEDRFKNSNSGLSTAGIAGMVIGILVACGLVLAVIALLICKRRRSKDTTLEENHTQILYDEVEPVTATRHVDGYEEWTPDGSPAPPNPPSATTSDPPADTDATYDNISSSPPQSVETLYAVPDKTKKHKTTRPESESVEIVDNVIYCDTDTPCTTHDDDTSYCNVVS